MSGGCIPGTGAIWIQRVVPPPAPGADWTWLGLVGGRFRLISCEVDLATDPVVANRTVILEIRDATGVVCQFKSSIVQTANLTWRYLFNSSMHAEVVTSNANMVQVGIDNNTMLVEADHLRVHVDTMQGGDQLDNLVMRLERWIG